MPISAAETTTARANENLGNKVVRLRQLPGLSGQAAEMDSADENRLAAALEHGTTVLHANASTMTNSDSCHDWTGDFQYYSRPNAPLTSPPNIDFIISGIVYYIYTWSQVLCQRKQPSLEMIVESKIPSYFFCIFSLGSFLYFHICPPIGRIFDCVKLRPPSRSRKFAMGPNLEIACCYRKVKVSGFVYYLYVTISGTRTQSSSILIIIDLELKSQPENMCVRFIEYVQHSKPKKSRCHIAGSGYSLFSK